MKLRPGFVSNSSSSSFVIIGFRINKKILDTITDAARKKNKRTEKYLCCSKCGFTPSGKPKFCEKCGGEIHTLTRPKELEFYEAFETLGLEYYSETDLGSVGGVSIKNIKISEIDKHKAKLVEIFGDIDFEIISGTYYC